MHSQLVLTKVPNTSIALLSKRVSFFPSFANNSHIEFLAKIVLSIFHL